jgi:hypothetical protein
MLGIENGMIQDGIEYLDEDAETFPNGSVRDAVLVRDSEIQGLLCAGGRSVVFFPSGQLRLAWLSHQTFVGVVCCDSGIVYLHEKGTLLNTRLAASLKFDSLTVPAGARVTLDEDGILLERSCQLSADQTVGGFPCAAEFDVWLYPSGQPSLIVLSSSSVVDGREFPRGTELFLEEDGKVLEFHQRNLDSERRYKKRVFGVYEAPYE